MIPTHTVSINKGSHGQPYFARKQL